MVAKTSMPTARRMSPVGSFRSMVRRIDSDPSRFSELNIRRVGTPAAASWSGRPVYQRGGIEGQEPVRGLRADRHDERCLRVRELGERSGRVGERAQPDERQDRQGQGGRDDREPCRRTAVDRRDGDQDRRPDRQLSDQRGRRRQRGQRSFTDGRHVALAAERGRGEIEAVEDVRQPPDGGDDGDVDRDRHDDRDPCSRESVRGATEPADPHGAQDGEGEREEHVGTDRRAHPVDDRDPHPWLWPEGTDDAGSRWPPVPARSTAGPAGPATRRQPGPGPASRHRRRTRAARTSHPDTTSSI